MGVFLTLQKCSQSEKEKINEYTKQDLLRGGWVSLYVKVYIAIPITITHKQWRIFLILWKIKYDPCKFCWLVDWPNHFIHPVGSGGRTRRVLLWRGVTSLPTNILGMTQKCIWLWGSSPRALENIKDLFIAITPSSTLTLISCTCSGQDNGSNRTVQSFSVDYLTESAGSVKYTDCFSAEW